MPFLVNGQINGSDYEDAQVTASKMSTIFPEIKQYLEGESAVISFSPKNVKKVGGNIITPLSFTSATYFNGTYKGNAVSVRYFESKTKRRGETQYLPSTLTILYRQQSQVFMKERNLDKLIFFLLHPLNKNSPMAKPNRDLIQVYNSQMAAKEAAENSKLLSDLLATINADKERNPFALIVNAMGLKGPKGFRIATQKLSVDMAYTSLTKFAIEDTSAITKAYGSSETMAAGLFRTALGYSIVRNKQEGGQNKWMWNDSKAIFLNVPTGENNISYGIRHFANGYDDLYQTIENKVLPKKAKAKTTE